MLLTALSFFATVSHFLTNLLCFCIGAGVKLLELKREIITIKAFNQKMDFELKVTDDNTGVDYEDDDCIVVNGTQVVVKRVPPVGLGLLARLSAAPSTIQSDNQISMDSVDSVAATEVALAIDDDNVKLDLSNAEDDTIIEAAADMYVYLHYLTNAFHADVDSSLCLLSPYSYLSLTYLSTYNT